MKLRIFQPIVPEYRVALFDGLAEIPGLAVEVVAACSIGGDKSCELHKARFDYAHPFVRVGPLLWQSNLSLRGIGRGDVIVVCGDVHQLSSIWIAVKAKMLGIKVVWWGHHTTATSSRMSTRIRLAIAKCLSDVMLVYTRTGINYLVEHGFSRGKVFATGNTIDQEPIKNAIASYDGVDPFNGHLGLLCCSVLREKVRLDLAIRAMADPRLAQVRLAVIGDGPCKAEYMDVAKAVGVSDRVIWIGATRNQNEMAPWFLSAKAFVYPGAVGLSILHAMSYGLPVVVHGNPVHQMPEFEIMEDGRTGLCFAEGSVKDLADKIAWMLENESRRKEMSLYCHKQAFECYSMTQMVANFRNAVEAAIVKEEE